MKEDVLIKIAELITDNDVDVVAEVRECVCNIEAYMDMHLEEFEERCNNLDTCSEEDLQWLGMVNCLIHNNYVAEFDEHTNITDFGWGIKALHNYARFNLSLDNKFQDEDYGITHYDENEDDEYAYDYDSEDEFLESDDIVSWCRALDSKWAEEDICLGMIDVDSDKYVIFPIEGEVLEELEDLADSIDKHISSVY